MSGDYYYYLFLAFQILHNSCSTSPGTLFHGTVVDKALALRSLNNEATIQDRWILYCSSTVGSVGAGLWNKRSFPVPVLGNAITSRIVSVLQRMDMRRSKPITVYRKRRKRNNQFEIRRNRKKGNWRRVFARYGHKEWCIVCWKGREKEKGRGRDRD